MAIVRCRRIWVRLALGAWFGGMLVVGAGLLAKHAVALPAPKDGRVLSASLNGFRNAREQGRWLAVHALYAECRCSQRITTHLLETPRPAGWGEIVLWVGKAPPPEELTAHFDVRRLSPAELARLGIAAAPSLVVVAPDGRVRYAGGYTQRKQGPVIDDLGIFDRSVREPRVAALPVFGCAVSDELKRVLSVLPSP